MKLPVAHLPAIHLLRLQRIELPAACQIRQLIQRRIRRLERPPDLTGRVCPLMSYAVHEEIDALLWCPVAEMIVQRENDPRTPVHMPEQHSNPVLRALWKLQVPQQQLPVK